MRFSIFQFRTHLTRRSYLGIAVTSILLFLLVWEGVYAMGWFPKDYFPNPQAVFESGKAMTLQEGFLLDILASTLRIMTAFALSALFAVPLGLSMSCFKVIEAFCEPLIDFIRYVPVPALLPLFVIWGGIGEVSKFLVLFFGTFFQLVLLIMDDANQVPHIFFDLAKTMGASTRHLYRNVLLPMLMPQIYDRLRITLGWCWTYLVIAELIAVEHGVGHVIKEAQRFNGTAQLFWCCLILGLIGLGTDYLAKWGYYHLFPYSVKVGGQRS